MTNNTQTKTKLIPKLRFKEFEGDWRQIKLNKVTNSISSGKIKPKDVGEFLVYGSTGVIGKSDICSHKGENILIARVGANAGKINKVKGDYSVTDNTLVVDLKEDIVNNTFLVGFLTKFNLNRLIFGSGQPLITGGLLKSIKLIKPTLQEQQKIATFLTAVDTKIQQLTRKKELLENYKKGVMQQLFSQQLRFKNDDGLDFPDWEEKKLKELIEKERKIRYGIVQPGKYESGGRFMIRGQDYSSVKGWANSSEFFRVSESIEKKYKKARVKKGDLLITIVGAGTGWLEVVPDFLEGANITQTTGRIAINKTVASPNYVKNYFFSYKGRKEINRYIKGQAQPGLNIGDVEIFKIPLPCLEEQQKIANYLSALDEKMTNVELQITNTQTFKKGLLQQLFV